MDAFTQTFPLTLESSNMIEHENRTTRIRFISSLEIN